MTPILVVIGLFLLIGAGGLLLTTFQTGNTGAAGGSALLALAGIVFVILSFAIVSVEPNERLVVFNRVSGDLGTPREPGLQIINPITTSYRLYDISRQTYTMSALNNEGDLVGDDAVNARTSGGQEVFIDVTVIYTISIEPEDLNLVHTNWPGDRYRDELGTPPDAQCSPRCCQPL